jgi:single-strand DNA-binding protein
VSVFGGSAESVSQYMRRGSRVGVDGRLEWREWETADEQKRQAVSIVADTLQFLEGPRSGSGAPEQSDTELAGVAAADSEADLVF